VRTSKWLLKPSVPAAAISLFFLLTQSASAHVKWFCAYDIVGQPRGLENVLCPDFEELTVLAIALLMAGCLIERTPLGDAMLRALDRVTGWLRTNTELLIRAGCGFFFVAVWTIGGVILTPELKTQAWWIPWLQLGLAACLLWRRTMPITAIGIAFLFGYAVYNYSLFHLADYPIFLGVAVYLALTGLQRDFFGIKPIDIVRWSAGITLMWASIEKWAYPEWSFPLFIQYPDMTLGFDQEFYMRAAGVIEFVLAFSLIWTSLVRRTAAIMLTAMFTAAIFQFGKVDAIGHMPIIVVLLAIVGDDTKTAPSRVRHPVAAPFAYSAACVFFIAAYYLGHAYLVGPGSA
jgi:hypothetical protein